MEYGFKRIDFLRLLNDELILLKLEDNSPNMNLEKLNLELRNKIIDKYKENIYKYLSE